MKKLLLKLYVVTILSMLSACAGVRSLSNEGEIVEINTRKKTVLIEFPCKQLPYKNQPCFGADYFDLSLFPDAEIGKKVTIKIN